ncbi:MAG: S-layer homology domain-containing protein [Oscillospiraceae bacterium]|jgi:hypothetical protein|nr:S-layer homology domain-containing protein [Oscillospiraceae bacterium]
MKRTKRHVSLALVFALVFALVPYVANTATANTTALTYTNTAGASLSITGAEKVTTSYPLTFDGKVPGGYWPYEGFSNQNYLLENVHHYKAQYGSEITLNSAGTFNNTKIENSNLYLNHRGGVYPNVKLDVGTSVKPEPGVYTIINFMTSQYRNDYKKLEAVIIEIFDANGEYPLPAIYGYAYPATENIGGVAVSFRTFGKGSWKTAKDGIPEITYYVRMNMTGAVTYTSPETNTIVSVDTKGVGDRKQLSGLGIDGVARIFIEVPRDNAGYLTIDAKLEPVGGTLEIPGGGAPPTAPQKDPTDVSVAQPMTLNASVYAPGSQMTITLSNVTQKMIDDGAYVQIRKPETNAEISTLISSTPMYNAVQMVVAPTMVYTVTVRTSGVNAIEEGNYEVRFYVGNNSIATQPNVGLIATVPITISRNTTPPTTNPLDSASSWARDGITSALSKGFVPSDLQGSYTSTITRAEFCRMAVKWLEYKLGKDIDAIVAEKGIADRAGHTFSDTTDPAILAAYRLGVTAGSVAPTATAPGQFNPSGQFTRLEAAMMIMNACGVAGMDVSNAPQASFADMNQAASWAHPGINFVHANGIMSGDGTNFLPAQTYSREQSILTFNNIK